MKKVTDYCIALGLSCWNPSSVELPSSQKEISKLLREGWQPWGCPFYDSGSGKLGQALVKYEEQDGSK